MLWVSDRRVRLWCNRGWLGYSGQAEARVDCNRWLRFRCRRADRAYRWVLMHRMRYRQDRRSWATSGRSWT